MEFDAAKMEFDALAKFFASLKYAKRRYPMIITYNKHLEKISSDANEATEVENFKRFLVANQSLAEKKLTSPAFKTGKPSLTLAMDNFSNFPGQDTESFWDNILEIEKVMFPEGKPAEMGAEGLTGAMAALQNNPIIADVIEQVKNVSMGSMDDISDVNALLSKPEFQKMANNIKNNIQTGKYSIKDLTGTIADVINGVQDELDDDTKNTLKAVTETMGAVERNEQVDMNNLLNMVSGLKLENIGGAQQ